MSNDSLLQMAYQSIRTQNEDINDLKKFFKLIIANWYYFMIAMIVALAGAYLYNAYTTPIYRVSTTLLIDEEKKGGFAGNNQLLEGNGPGNGTKNLDNQIMILSSKTLIGKALDELPFEVEFYRRGIFNKIELIPHHPIKIVPIITDSLPRDIEFTFKYLNKNNFSLDSKSKDFGKFHIQASFGEIIKTPGGRFRIELNSDSLLVTYNDSEVQFLIHSRKMLVASFSSQLKVDVVSKLATGVKISLEGPNKEQNRDFLNKLTEIFLINSLDKKNQEAVRTIQFIDDQLIGISDSLVITENKLQQFRSLNRVMDLSQQGQVIINQAMSLENEKARLGIEANYYNYLAEYLSKDNVGEVPIAPATMGITDPGLTKLVADLAILQGEFYSKNLGEKNPLQSQLAQRVQNTKAALMETLNGVRLANKMAMNEINTQISTVNAQASALPVTERQLLGIERKYKLNDELYTFLLEKRAGAQIQKASNMPDNEVVDLADADVLPIKPKRRLVYFLAMISGIGIPLFWIWIAEGLNNMVRSDEDINKITVLPIAGHIPHSLQKKNIAVFEEPQSNVAEAFRSLRSRIHFFTKETKTPIILITSSMPEEGKTFSAINLASAYSLMGKKTVLIGFDLRRPEIYSDFGLDNEQGVSTWLTGRDKLQDVIKETPYKDLYIISAGPVPPNPSELTVLEKTSELMSLLKDEFEYIIIDSSPIGTVSDSFHLASLADISILIVRQNLTLKSMFENTIKELKVSDIKNVCLVVNDQKPDGRRYVYNYSKEKDKRKT